MCSPAQVSRIRWNRTVSKADTKLLPQYTAGPLDNDPFKVLGEKDPEKLPWRELEVDYVIESTGRFRKIE